MNVPTYIARRLRHRLNLPSCVARWSKRYFITACNNGPEKLSFSLDAYYLKDTRTAQTNGSNTLGQLIEICIHLCMIFQLDVEL